MKCVVKIGCALVLIVTFSSARGENVIQRVSILGVLSEETQISRQSFDRQSWRLMWEPVYGDHALSTHILLDRQSWDGLSENNSLVEYPFRRAKLQVDLINALPNGSADKALISLDHFSFKTRFERGHITLGRQPLDWGNGRLWQAHNVFGSFAPTTLDTEFKPGIDALIGEYYFDDFSYLSMAVVANSEDLPVGDISVATRYQTLIGEESEVSLLLGRVLDQNLFGVGVESVVYGIGIRFESTVKLDEQHRQKKLLISGMDYQFESGLAVVLEWRYQQRDGQFEENLPQAGPFHTGKHYLGMSLSKDLTPLLHASYLSVRSFGGDELVHSSALHQLSFSYSMSDESVFLISLLSSVGSDDIDDGVPRSTFGLSGNSISLNYRVYF